MPARYLAIKRLLRKEHPDWSEDKLEEEASKRYNGSLRPGEKAVGGSYHKKGGKE